MGNYKPGNFKDIDLKKLSTETGIIYGTLLYRYHHNLDLVTGGKLNV